MDALFALAGGDLEDLIAELTAMLIGGMVYVLLLGLVLILVNYILEGFAWMCIGRKAGLDSDFMPFIPVARQIYQMKIAKRPVWNIFFFSGTLIADIIGGAISYLFAVVLKAPAICMVLMFVYWLACTVFTFLYYRSLYKKYGFNPNTAWLNIVPGMDLVSKVFLYLIAFSNSIKYADYVDPIVNRGEEGRNPAPNKGVIVGVSGKYMGASFDIQDGSELIFGRDPQSVNIVFDQTSADVSRKHLKIRFDGRNNQYEVTDLNSTTGTYLDNGTRLEAGQPKYVAKGTVVYLGSTRQNSFRLN